MFWFLTLLVEWRLALLTEIQNTAKGSCSFCGGDSHTGLCLDMLSSEWTWSRQLRHKAQTGGLKRNFSSCEFCPGLQEMRVQQHGRKHDSPPHSSVYGVPHTTRQFSIPAGCLAIQLNSETIYLEIAPDPTG